MERHDRGSAPQSTPTGGMCSFTPQILNAQVFQANGVTPVAGKGPLVPGTDFSITYNGAPHLHAYANHAHRGRHDQPEPAFDHQLPNPDRREQSKWRYAHQRGRYDAVVQRPEQ